MKLKILFLALLFSISSHLYSQEIKYISDFGNSLDPTNFEFGSIDDITVVEDKIYVLDSILNKVHLLILENEEIRRFGEIDIQKGNGPGELNDLSALAASENNLAIADARSRRVVIFSNEGDLVSQFNIRFRPTNMHLLGEENRLLVTGFWPTVQDKILHVIDFNGNEINTYIERPSNWMQIARTGNFERVLPGSGHFYVSYPNPYKIEKYDWNGVLIDSYVKNETDNNIQADGRILRIRQRIIDLNFWDNKILALVLNDDVYSIDIFDQDLNPVNKISGDTLETDHASTMRIVSDNFFLIRQIEQIPYLRLYKIEK
ncbi:6-bladed beta-propeller [Rhodohalobacter mucosus]|uniref:6-bladed beta-propeller protein n=1 Tax=Rhodohalobacter mucosus TaxID=2079485 RepID=A0A316TSB2_9BACT|nr:6-bladed beta-propeller [Rhodohalobacter mucosus]PWN05112.1 hypothetical protein DDZ15_16285 [Rhodohalobacter mucosus]